MLTRDRQNRQIKTGPVEFPIGVGGVPHQVHVAMLWRQRLIPALQEVWAHLFGKFRIHDQWEGRIHEHLRATHRCIMR